MKLSRAELKALQDKGLVTSNGRKPLQRGKRKSPTFNKGFATLAPEQKMFDQLCLAHGIPVPDHEYHFALPRKWRFDKCWADHDIALEIQGGLFADKEGDVGRHARGAALRREHEKLNEAVCQGWMVMFCMPEDVESGAIFPLLKKAMGLE